MRSAFYFEDGHVVLTFPNGISISMCNYDGAHCTSQIRESGRKTFFSDTVEVLITRDVAGKLEDITGTFIDEATPDAANVSLEKIVELINTVRSEAHHESATAEVQ